MTHWQNTYTSCDFLKWLYGMYMCKGSCHHEWQSKSNRCCCILSNRCDPTGLWEFVGSSTYPASTVALITVIHFAYPFSLFLSGARVNAKDNKWLTPLHRAVASCSEVRHVLHIIGTTNRNKQMFSGSLMYCVFRRPSRCCWNTLQTSTHGIKTGRRRCTWPRHIKQCAAPRR